MCERRVGPNEKEKTNRNLFDKTYTCRFVIIANILARSTRPLLNRGSGNATDQDCTAVITAGVCHRIVSY